MPPRFFAPDLSGLNVLIELPVGEARHLTRVLSVVAGDQVSVFNGRGSEYLAQVEQVGTEGVTVRPYHNVVPVKEPAVALTVAAALLQGRTFDSIVRDVTMVGVVAVQPLFTDRTEPRGGGVERWTRIAVASAKQCRRAPKRRQGVFSGGEELYRRKIACHQLGGQVEKCSGRRMGEGRAGAVLHRNVPTLKLCRYTSG